MEPTPFREILDVVRNLRGDKPKDLEEHLRANVKLAGLSGRLLSLTFAASLAVDYTEIFPTGLFEELRYGVLQDIIGRQSEPMYFFMMERVLFVTYGVSCCLSLLSRKIERHYNYFHYK